MVTHDHVRWFNKKVEDVKIGDKMKGSGSLTLNKYQYKKTGGYGATRPPIWTPEGWKSQTNDDCCHGSNLCNDKN